MSAISQQRSTTTPRTSANPNVVSLNSPTIARAVIAELLLNPDLLSSAMKKVLADNEGSERALTAAMERITIWADLSSLLVHSLHTEESQWRKAALTYCILRQAHYTLLKKLFKVSRIEATRLRNELKCPRETRPKIIPDHAISSIHKAWHQISKECDHREADRWVLLAERFPQYGLNSLYLVIEQDAFKPSREAL